MTDYTPCPRCNGRGLIPMDELERPVSGGLKVRPSSEPPKRATDEQMAEMRRLLSNQT
jgi:hypothetical protein